jgi:S1-C subfamily serine protease
MGFSGRESVYLTSTVTAGIVSESRDLGTSGIQSFIQTDAVETVEVLVNTPW